MRNISLSHREQGYGYLLVIEGVQETILMGADDLLEIFKWGIAHKEELEQESNQERDEIARRLLDHDA